MKTSLLKHLSLAVLTVASLGACTTMTSEPEGMERAEKAVAVTASNKLLKFNAGRPGRILATLNITGLQPSETLLGIDYRVAKDQLYALGSSGRLYIINEDTAAATVVGMPFAVKLEGTQFGFDFNPTVDRIRLVGNNGQNLRLNPETGGIAAVDGNINGAPGARIAGSAYTVRRITNRKYGSVARRRATSVPFLVLLGVLAVVNVFLFLLPMSHRI